MADKSKGGFPFPFLDVFVVGRRSQSLPAVVLAHSVARHAGWPVRVCPMLDMAEPWSEVLSGSPGGALVLRQIAQAKRFRGVALVVPADGLVVADVAELFRVAFGGRRALVPAGVAWREAPLFLLNCERDVWADAPRQNGVFAPLTDEDVGATLPAAWADVSGAGGRWLRYAELAEAPWLSAGNPGGQDWLLELRLMLDRGEIGWQQLDEEVAAGFARASLPRELRLMPHLNGFDPMAAGRLAELDRPKVAGVAA